MHHLLGPGKDAEGVDLGKLVLRHDVVEARPGLRDPGRRGRPVQRYRGQAHATREAERSHGSPANAHEAERNRQIRSTQERCGDSGVDERAQQLERRPVVEQRHAAEGHRGKKGSTTGS